MDADENPSCATGVVAPYLRAPTGGGDVIQAEGFDSACMRPERTRGLLFFVLIFHFFFFSIYFEDFGKLTVGGTYGAMLFFSDQTGYRGPL